MNISQDIRYNYQVIMCSVDKIGTLYMPLDIGIQLIGFWTNPHLIYTQPENQFMQKSHLNPTIKALTSIRTSKQIFSSSNICQ